MDDRFAPQPIAGWFMIAALASLVFMALGCVALAMHLAADSAALPLDQRALFEAEPAWVLAASCVAFVAGMLGTVLLLMRRKLAVPLLLFSLAAMVAWLGGMFATDKFRDLLSTNQIAALLVVAAIAWTIYWFARHSRQRGWLR